MADFMAKASIQMYKKSIFEDMVSCKSQMDQIPMEKLIATYAKTIHHAKELSICKSVTSIISFLCSSALIWIILRSNKGLSTNPNRLLLGLSIYDIMLSLSASSFNVLNPADNFYFKWNARGNATPCDGQGFMRDLRVQ